MHVLCLFCLELFHGVITGVFTDRMSDKSYLRCNKYFRMMLYYVLLLHEDQSGSHLQPLDDGAWQGVASFCGDLFCLALASSKALVCSESDDGQCDIPRWALLWYAKHHFDHADELGHTLIDASVSTEGASLTYFTYISLIHSTSFCSHACSMV